MGGNLGGDAAVLRRFRAAARAIARLGYARDPAVSSVYRSDPVGRVTDQPAFLNAALAFDVEQSVSPQHVLADLLAIEAELGRSRQGAVAGGPRPIDLDLLLVGEKREQSAGPPELSLPHPRICERAFVLRPMRELVGGDFVVPGSEQTVDEWLATPDVVRQRTELLAESLFDRAESA